MKKITLASLVAVVGIASIGCSTTANTNTVKTTNLNANTAVVVNSNSTMGVNTNTMSMNTNSSSSRYNANMSRADYDKSTDFDADRASSTIGQGADDKWIWFKTRAALLGTNDLRESTINVDVSNGVITLKGSVANQAQKDMAATVAKGIEGQKGIKNDLKVQPNDSITNTSSGSMTDSDKKPANANK
jgi:hyperosmotically inducible protein